MMAEKKQTESKRKRPRGRPITRRAAPRAVAVNAEGKNLIIVESPAKARTIEKYLGADYKVMASIGHVIDLPLSKLASTWNGFKPDYEVIKGKKSVLGRAAQVGQGGQGGLYLAPDPDREGEAIGIISPSGSRTPTPTASARRSTRSRSRPCARRSTTRAGIDMTCSRPAGGGACWTGWSATN